jgi:protein TonB
MAGMERTVFGRLVGPLALAALAATLAAPGAAQPAPAPAAQPCKTAFTDPEPINKGQWTTFDDYPRSALTKELEGVVTVRFYVTAAGRVETAEVVTSSGHQVLDDATIRAVTRRARFRPATRKCQPVPGEFTTTFRWLIP